MTLITGRVVHDVHVAVIINPQSTHNNVMHGRRHFSPRYVETAVLELQMTDVDRRHLTLGCEHPVEDPITRY